MMLVITLKVIGNVIFIRVKVLTRLAKIAKEKAKQLSNDTSSNLNPKIRVF